MNAIDMLTDDHEKVSNLFDEFEAEQKKNIADTIFTELEIHTKLEEEIFYPAAQPVAGDLVAESLEDHATVKGMIEELRKLDIKNKDFNTKFEELRANVEQHIDVEENELFPKVEEKLANELDRLGNEMQKRKEQLHRGKATRAVP